MIITGPISTTEDRRRQNAHDDWGLSIGRVELTFPEGHAIVRKRVALGRKEVRHYIASLRELRACPMSPVATHRAWITSLKGSIRDALRRYRIAQEVAAEWITIAADRAAKGLED